MVTSNMCLGTSYNVLSSKLVSSGGSNLCLIASYNILSGELASSSGEQYLLCDRPQYAGS